MSIQTVEIALPTEIDSVSVAFAQPIAIIEIRQGPVGAAGAGEWGDIGGTITDQTDLVSYIGTRLASGEATAKNVEVFVRNTTGATITKGSIIYINGASGQRPTITKAQANNDANSAQTIGFVKADIANNGTGYVITSGDLENVDTQALTAGQQLYLSPTTAGAWTTTKPSAPQHLVYVGIVVSAHPTQGIIYVSIQNGYELEELHNVAITSPLTGQVLRYNATTGLWSNQTLPTSVGGFGTEDAGKFAVFNQDGGIAAYAEGVYTGGSFDSDAGAGVTGNSLTGDGVFAESVSGTGLRAQTDSGTYNAIFGSEASPNDRSFVARVLGAFGWFRGLFTARIQAAATLTGNRTYTLPDATGNVLLDSTLAPTINAATEDTVALAADQLPMTETAASGALRRITFANLFAFVRAQLGLMTNAVTAAGEWAFSSATRPTSAGTGTPAANSLVTQGDVEARYFNPLRWMSIPMVTGWQSTASGSGTGLDQSLLSLSIRSASTIGFGAMTAFTNQLNNERATRLGSGVGLGGYGTLNFANKLKMAVRMGSFFNFDTTKQDWAIVIGSQAKNVAGIANILPSTTSSDNGYVAIECIGGNVRIVTQNATTPSTRGAIIDTWVSSSNHKSYFIEIAGGIVTVSDGFTGLVLGTHSGAPTATLLASASPVAIATQSSAVSSLISGSISIYQMAIAFE
jgi:hypothetical protein